MQKPASTNEATPYAPAYYDDIKAGSLRSARVVLPLVLDIVAPHSVLDVGCGVGTWLSVCSELGVPDVLGLDGGYVEREQLFIAPDRFIATDLEQPIDLDRRFDLAMSLEVAEHLAPAAADAFVASLVRHADVVLFSAAIPEQGGAHHVNEQWPAYWAARFAAHGYLPADILRPSVWLDDRVEAWYAQNVLLYVGGCGTSRLTREGSSTCRRLRPASPRKQCRCPSSTRASTTGSRAGAPRATRRWAEPPRLE